MSGIDYAAVAKAGGLSKGEPRKTTKARKARHEAAVIKAARVEVAARDQICRAWDFDHGCDGPLELAHLPAWRRSLTRGRAPASRHCVEGAAMLCRRHHRLLDTHVIDVRVGPDGANGPLWWGLV